MPETMHIIAREQHQTNTKNLPIRHDIARFLHSGAAALLLFLMFVGFQQFYLHGRAFPNRPLAPPILGLLIAHGVAMTAWVVLLLTQSLLILNRIYRAHMLLGRIGAVLAAFIFILGFWLAIEAPSFSPPELRLWNLPYKQFMAVPLMSITMFAIYVGLGVWNRRRPRVHGNMMLLATLVASSASLSRIDAISALYRDMFWGTVFGPFFSVLVIGAVFLILDWVLTGTFNCYYATGWIGLVLASAGTMQLATTQLWDRFATFLLRP